MKCRTMFIQMLIMMYFSFSNRQCPITVEILQKRKLKVRSISEICLDISCYGMTNDDCICAILFLRRARRCIRCNFRIALIARCYFANSLTTYTDNRTLITELNLSLSFYRSVTFSRLIPSRFMQKFFHSNYIQNVSLKVLQAVISKTEPKYKKIKMSSK